MSPLDDARARLLGVLQTRDPLSRFVRDIQWAFEQGKARRARVEAEMRRYRETGVPPFHWMFNPLRARIDYQSSSRKTFLVADLGPLKEPSDGDALK